MRTVRGSIVLPPNAPARTCKSLVVEVRDVSLLDAPSTVVASVRMENVALSSDGRVAFQLAVPDVGAGRSLSLRVHGSLDGSDQLKPGDLLTTASCPVPATGAAPPLTVPVKVV